jgi:hypothetical protein
MHLDPGVTPPILAKEHRQRVLDHHRGRAHPQDSGVFGKAAEFGYGASPWEPSVPYPGVDERGYQIANKGLFVQWQDGMKVVVWPDQFATARPRVPTPAWSLR